MSELVSCKTCNHQVAKTAKSCPNCGVDKPAKHPPPPASAKEQFIGLIIILLIGFSLYSCMSDSPEEKRAKEKAKAEKAVSDKKAGFHCLSAWDGAHTDVVRYVKNQLRDPSSFEHIGTKITPVNDKGEHVLIMQYRAKNGFGGMVPGIVTAKISNSSCSATIVSQ